MILIFWVSLDSEVEKDKYQLCVDKSENLSMCFYKLNRD